ncbi:hypothetical protein V8F33_011949 [Rhypophila sp. PSN 637]
MKWQLSILSLSFLSAVVLAAPTGNPAKLENKRDASAVEKEDEAELLWNGLTWRYRASPERRDNVVHVEKRAPAAMAEGDEVETEDEAELLWNGGLTWRYRASPEKRAPDAMAESDGAKTL